MSLANDYARQAAWRDWTSAFALLPPIAGRRILDFGCAIGDQSAMLAARGAEVVGIDHNEDLLRLARGRGLSRSEFRSTLPEDVPPFDGIWCSFAAAYFPDLTATLRGWRSLLAPGGFVALVEIDDLFAHTPLSAETAATLKAFADSGPTRGYDFRRGAQLRPALEAAGFTVLREVDLPDRELAFDGPADTTVVEAWQSRFDRMLGLQKLAPDTYEAVVADFLACLQRPDHRSLARVRMAVAVISDV